MNQLPESISGPSKAAMFLLGIGDAVSVEILRQLDQDEIRRITTEITVLESVAPQQMAAVFHEFEALANSSRLFAKGGVGPARRLIEQALGPQSAQKLLDPENLPQPKSEEPESELSILQNIEPRQLARLLAPENPQTVALVLANLSPEAGGALLRALPEELQAQAAFRLATMENVSSDVVRKVGEALGAKLKSVRQVSRSDSFRSLSRLLNELEPAASDRILSEIEKENAEAARSIRDLMFTFDDILNIDKQGMKALVGQLDSKVLMLALKGASPGLRAHFTQCMSQRASEMMLEDMDAMGAVRIRDVQTAQQNVVAIVRKLQADGVIASSRGGDEYVS